MRDDSFIERTHKKNIQLSEIYIRTASTGEIKVKKRLNPIDLCPTACGMNNVKSVPDIGLKPVLVVQNAMEVGQFVAIREVEVITV